jgi:hypothetical protein
VRNDDRQVRLCQPVQCLTTDSTIGVCSLRGLKGFSSIRCIFGSPIVSSEYRRYFRGKAPLWRISRNSFILKTRNYVIFMYISLILDLSPNSLSFLLQLFTLGRSIIATWLGYKKANSFVLLSPIYYTKSMLNEPLSHYIHASLQLLLFTWDTCYCQSDISECFRFSIRVLVCGYGH